MFSLLLDLRNNWWEVKEQHHILDSHREWVVVVGEVGVVVGKEGYPRVSQERMGKRGHWLEEAWLGWVRGDLVLVGLVEEEVRGLQWG